MPELPEVEVGRRNLTRWIGGSTIEHVVVAKSPVLHGGSPEHIVRALRGRTLRSIARHGKWIRIVLDDGTRVFSHFGMSGKWVLRAIDAPAERWERMRLDVRKGTKHRSVRYVDPRMLGRITVSPHDVDGWLALGPDPLNDGIDLPRLQTVLARRKKTIKETLLDQAVLAGIGNIQATDALWHARIHPQRRANALSASEVRALVRGIGRSIRETLAHESGPEITYVEEAGAKNPFRVYGRGGEPCPRCKTALTRIVLGGRGTVFCGKCQLR